MMFLHTGEPYFLSAYLRILKHFLFGLVAHGPRQTIPHSYVLGRRMPARKTARTLALNH